MRRTCHSFLCFASLFAFASCGGNAPPDSEPEDAAPTPQTDSMIDSPDPAAGSSEPIQEALAEFRKNLKQKLAIAAGIPTDQLQVIVNSDTSPSVGDHKNQPLSLILLCERPAPETAYAGEPRALRNEFRFLTPGAPRPSALIEWSNETLDEQGRFSFLQPLGIQKIETELDGERLQGTTFFEAADLFAGMVGFTAEWRDEEWQITEFRLPVRRSKTTLQADGTWKAGDPVLAEMANVRLPRVDVAYPRTEESFPRFTIWVYPFESSIVWARRGDKVDIINAAQLVTEAKAFAEQHSVLIEQSVVEIRADQSVATKDLLLLLRQLSGAGFEKISLAVCTMESGAVGDLWIHSESRPFDGPDENLLPPILIRALANESGVLLGVKMAARSLPSPDALTLEVIELIGSDQLNNAPRLEAELVADEQLKWKYLAGILQKISLYEDDQGQAVPIVGYVSLNPSVAEGLLESLEEVEQPLLKAPSGTVN